MQMVLSDLHADANLCVACEFPDRKAILSRQNHIAIWDYMCFSSLFHGSYFLKQSQGIIYPTESWKPPHLPAQLALGTDNSWVFHEVSTLWHSPVVFSRAYAAVQYVSVADLTVLPLLCSASRKTRNITHQLIWHQRRNVYNRSKVCLDVKGFRLRSRCLVTFVKNSCIKFWGRV